MIPNANRIMKNYYTKAKYGDISADLCAGKHIIFIYTNINEYQYVGETEVLLLRDIASKQRLKNGSVCAVEPIHWIDFYELRQ